jgi:hypothetical protein
VLGDFVPAPVGNFVFAVPIAFLPVAAGIAILRYRLYDIDGLINRALVYGLLTALLAGVYGGGLPRQAGDQGCCGVELRGFEPLASSVRALYRVFAHGSTCVEDREGV